MLFFLSIAQNRGFIVDQYVDDAIGTMAKNAQGKLCMTQVILRPKAQFSGDQIPAIEHIEKMHHRAHELCFIANSVTTEVTVEVQA